MSDAYGRRNRRKRARGQGCLIALLVGGSVTAGVSTAARVLSAPQLTAPRPLQGIGGESDAAQLGLVSEHPLAGGKGSDSPCRYCGEIGGHTGQCPVVSRCEELA